MKEILHRVLKWFFRWTWAIFIVWIVAFLELLTGKEVAIFRAISNWIVAIIGGFMIIGYISAKVHGRSYGDKNGV